MGIQIMEMNIENWPDLDIVDESSVPIPQYLLYLCQSMVPVPLRLCQAGCQDRGNGYCAVLTNYNNTIL